MRIAFFGLLIALVSALLLFAAGAGYRTDIWTLRTAFTFVRWAAYGGVAAVVISLVGLVLARKAPGRVLVPAALGFAIGIVCVAIPWQWRQRAQSVPPIHDVTTDTAHPPQFVAVLPLRASAPNPAEYGGPEIAAQQGEAYPHIAPLVLDLEPPAAFQRALEAARAMGWDIVAADSSARRIEATATTFWFGFKDDVVVRLTPAESGGTRVDVRSVSRVGRSDVGTNARRIREYLGRLRDG